MSIYSKLLVASRVMDVGGELPYSLLVETLSAVRSHRLITEQNIDCIDLYVTEPTYDYMRALFLRRFGLKYGYGVLQPNSGAEENRNTCGLQFKFSKWDEPDLGASIALIVLDRFPVSHTQICALDFSDIPITAEGNMHPERHVIFTNVNTVRI